MYGVVAICIMQIIKGVLSDGGLLASTALSLYNWKFTFFTWIPLFETPKNLFLHVR